MGMSRCPGAKETAGAGDGCDVPRKAGETGRVFDKVGSMIRTDGLTGIGQGKLLCFDSGAATRYVRPGFMTEVSGRAPM